MGNAVMQVTTDKAQHWKSTDELKMIENELVPVYVTSSGEKVVDGRELHVALQSKQDFSTWVKKRLFECDALENRDFSTAPQIYGTANGGHSTRLEYTILLDSAKEMAMLERNEIGKRVRKYFIEVDNRHKRQQIIMSELSPELQMFNQIFQSVAQQQLEQKRQAEKISEIENNQKAINTALLGQREDSFKDWVNKCLSTIAESPNYQYIGSREERHRAVRAESYERLNKKKPCRLKQRVETEKGRAATAGASRKQIDSINKLSIIEGDKALKPLYEAVIREMMIAYCVEVA